jgi:hypothetical protein
MENNFMNKYLKYKTKYLNLKNSLSVKQTGGNNKSIYGDAIMEINNLTETPTFLEAYGYELEGGDNHSTTLSEKSLDTTTHSASNKSESDHSASDKSVETTTTKSDQSSVLSGGSEFNKKVSKKNKKNFFDDSDLESSSTDLSSLSSSDSESDSD